MPFDIKVLHDTVWHVGMELCQQGVVFVLHVGICHIMDFYG